MNSSFQGEKDREKLFRESCGDTIEHDSFDKLQVVLFSCCVWHGIKEQKKALQRQVWNRY